MTAIASPKLKKIPSDELLPMNKKNRRLVKTYAGPG